MEIIFNWKAVNRAKEVYFLIIVHGGVLEALL